MGPGWTAPLVRSESGVAELDCVFTTPDPAASPEAEAVWTVLQHDEAAGLPSVAYRIRVGDRSLVFGSDQNGSDEKFVRFADGADALIMHLGLSARAPDPLGQLHARPAAVGQIAQKAKAKRLVLSHFMQAPPTVKTREWFSLFDLDGAVGEVRKHYSEGRIDTAVDLQCIPIR